MTNKERDTEKLKLLKNGECTTINTNGLVYRVLSVYVVFSLSSSEGRHPYYAATYGNIENVIDLLYSWNES